MSARDKEVLASLGLVLKEMGTMNLDEIVVKSYYEDVTGYDAIESAHIYLVRVDSTKPYNDMNTPENMLTEVIDALKTGSITSKGIALEVYDKSTDLEELAHTLRDVLVYGFEPYESVL